MNSMNELSKLGELLRLLLLLLLLRMWCVYRVCVIWHKHKGEGWLITACMQSIEFPWACLGRNRYVAMLQMFYGNTVGLRAFV